MANKSITMEVRVWYDEKSRHIKIAGKGLTASTVSNDPASRRYHPNLFRKLAKCLVDGGCPVPIWTSGMRPLLRSRVRDVIAGPRVEQAGQP
jgi:hypothetical protein